MYRRSVAAWIAWLSLVLAAWAPLASARAPERTRRVVLMQTPPALERALRTALMPWGMRVAHSQARFRPTPPRSPEQARVLARQLRADALVWLAESSRRHELWLYDSASGAMTVRGVPPPPFDETRAAALALSVKTELRKGTLANSPAPPSEAPDPSVTAADKGIVASVAPAVEAAPESAPVTEPAPVTDAAPPAPAQAEAAPPAPAPAESAPPPPEQPAPPPPPNEELDRPRRVSSENREPFEAPTLRLLLHAGVRGGANSLGITEGRYGVEGRWAPWATPTSLATLWFGARLDMGLPQTFANAAFRGEYSELGGGLGVGASMHINHWLDVGAQAGVSLYSASISGTRVPDNLAADQSSWGYLLHLRPEAELSLGTFGVLLQPALGTAPARKAYVVSVEQVDYRALEMNTLWWQVGIALRVNVN